MISKSWMASIMMLLAQQTLSQDLNPYSAVLETATCNGETVEVTIQLDEETSLSSAYLLNSEGSLPSGCTVTWRIALGRIAGLENWGIQVSGWVDLIDSENADGACVSSFVKVTDEDSYDDVSSISTTECGAKSVDFLTYEDSVTVTLSVADTGATGHGFRVRVQPVFACGGILSGSPGTEVAFSTPDYPTPYPPELACIWDVVPYEDAGVRVECAKFSVLRKTNGRCIEYLLLQQGGSFEQFCGKSLNGKKKAQTFAHPSSVSMYFRSAARYNPLPGFNCKIIFL